MLVADLQANSTVALVELEDYHNKAIYVNRSTVEAFPNNSNVQDTSSPALQCFIVATVMLTHLTLR